jgi:hypothetical protein
MREDGMGRPNSIYPFGASTNELLMLHINMQIQPLAV